MGYGIFFKSVLADFSKMFPGFLGFIIYTLKHIPFIRLSVRQSIIKSFCQSVSPSISRIYNPFLNRPQISGLVYWYARSRYLSCFKPFFLSHLSPLYLLEDHIKKEFFTPAQNVLSLRPYVTVCELTVKKLIVYFLQSYVF